MESAPTAWQETEVGGNPVPVSWVLYGDNEAGFSLGDYLPGIQVVIDPWLTFLGGSGDDSGTGVAVDGSGNVYVSGYSYTTWGSPVRGYTSDADAFAAKLNSSGNLGRLYFRYRHLSSRLGITSRIWNSSYRGNSERLSPCYRNHKRCND